MKKLIVTLFVLYRLLINVNAQVVTKDFKDTINLKEIVVTGTTYEVNKNIIPMAISVVSRTQIAESNESALLPVLSGRIPGLFVTERGVTGFGVSGGSAPCQTRSRSRPRSWRSRASTGCRAGRR